MEANRQAVSGALWSDLRGDGAFHPNDLDIDTVAIDPDSRWSAHMYRVRFFAPANSRVFFLAKTFF